MIDGAAYNLEDLKQIGYACYARALTPRGLFRGHKGVVNVPVMCGRVMVHPENLGGYDNALAVVPKDHIEATIEQVRQVVSQEQPMAAEIR